MVGGWVQMLLKPASIAVVGASEREDAVGSRVIRNLRLMKFEGPIFPVNPRYQAISGQTCYPSLSAIDQPVDAAFLAVPAGAGPDLVREAADCGIKALYIYASGYADGGAEGALLQHQVAEIAQHSGIAISGPNHIGLVNVLDRKAIWTPRYMRPITPGPVAVISQSGSVALALSEDERKLGLAYIVTVGNEAVVTVSDFLHEIVGDDRVSVILLFLETLRDPDGFAVAARAAAAANKKIVALKIGSSAGGRAAVQAHTGSLAGDDRLYDAFFKAVGVIRVHDLDEMLETAVLLSSSSRVPRQPGLAMLTLSGGEAALLADVGAALGLKFSTLSAETVASLQPAFPPYARIDNPVDGWGLGFNRERFKIQLDGLLADPSIGTIGFAVDAPGTGGGDVPYALVMAELCAEAKTEKQLVFVNNTSGTSVNADVRQALDGAGIAYLSGMRPSLSALRNLQKATQPLSPQRIQLAASGTVPQDEPSRFRYVTAAGVAMVATEVTPTADVAVALAETWGYPVVLKGIAASLPHKTDLGLVRLYLREAVSVRSAFADLERILRHYVDPPDSGYVTIQKMAPAGIELILGIRNQAGFGSFVVVGPGGTLVEIAPQSSIRLGPIDVADARAMLDETVAGTLLRGVRGAGPWDIEAVAEVISRFSLFGASLAGEYAAIEINPLIVGNKGVAGVDILFELHSESRS